MTGTRWLSDTELSSWLRFAAVLELLPSALDTQLNRDEGLTHFDYFTLAMISEADDRTVRMTRLAAHTNSTLPRLSRVITRLEGAGYVERRPCPEDRRATNVTLLPAGWEKLSHAAPGHVETVRSLVIDALTPTQLEQLETISAQLLGRLDPNGQAFSGWSGRRPPSSR